MKCLKGCLLFCTDLSAGPELEPFIACCPRVREEREEDLPPPPFLLTFSVFVLSCLSFSVSPFLSCLTHIASLHSSLTAALSVSYLPLFKTLVLCLGAGLMIPKSHYPSLTNAQKHIPSLSSSFTNTHLLFCPLHVSFLSL